MSQSTFVKSTIILTIATLLSKILGSVFRIPLQNIAGDEVLGIFNLVYPVYMVALYLSVAGIPLAISKLIAEAQAKQETYKIKKIYLTSSILAICFGVLSFSVIFSLSDLLAGALGGPSTKFALIVVACTLLVAPYMAVYRGFFQGFGNMQPTAVSQVLEQLIRATLIIVLAFVLVKMDYSTETIAGGVMAGSIIGALASLVYLRAKYQRSPVRIADSTKYESKDFSNYSKTILRISIPIAIGSITMALFNFVDSFTVSYALRANGVIEDNINYLYGVYGRGITLVQIVTVFASSIILPLVPLITKKLTEKDIKGTSAIVEQAHKMTHLISWPAALGLFALTYPLNLALFTNVDGSSMLAILNFSAVFTSLTLLGTGVLQGLNLARVGAFIVLGGVTLKIFTNIFFINWFGLDGAAWSTLLVYVVIFVLNSIFIYRAVAFKIVNSAVVKIVIASIVMAAVVGLPTLYFDVASWTRLNALGYSIIACGVGASIYFGLLWFTKAIDARDLARLPVVGKKFAKDSNLSQSAGDKTTVSSIKPSTTQTGSNTESSNSTIAGGNETTPPPYKPEKKGKSMKKRIGIWAFIVVLLIASSGGLINRWKAEKNNETFEIMIPFSEIKETANKANLEIADVLAQLKDAGLTTVSVSPFTLKTLEEEQYISLYEDYELAGQLRFTDYRQDINIQDTGYYITVPEKQHIYEMLVDAFDVQEKTIAEETFLYIPEADNDYDLETGIGYDVEVLDIVEKAGLNVTLRAENNESEKVNDMIVRQLLKLDTKNINGIIPAGTPIEIIGYNQPQMLDWMNALYDKGYFLYMIEGEKNRAKGEQTIARSNGYEFVRLHSMNARLENDLTLNKSIERTIRAVKERNIKSIMYHIREQGDANENLQETITYLSSVKESIPSNFSLGEPKVFEKVEVPGWATLMIALAGVLFIYLAAEMLGNRILQVLSALFMLALAGAYFVLDKIVFIQGFALIIACTTPIYAIYRSAKGSTNLRKIVVQYVKAAAISAAGIAIMVGLLNGNGFITGIEHFRGVKMVYLIPIVGVMIFVLLILSNLYDVGLKTALKNSVKLLNLEVRYWHIIVLIVIAAVGLFYISRTGNAGTASSLEITFRTWLEETLYVRPRTKEFLIGFPLFVLALYIMGINRKWGSILLIPGVIGFLSIVNTFTHLHIPLEVSVLRTIYGLVLGLIIGFVFIVMYKVGVKLVRKISARWM